MTTTATPNPPAFPGPTRRWCKFCICENNTTTTSEMSGQHSTLRHLISLHTAHYSFHTLHAPNHLPAYVAVVAGSAFIIELAPPSAPKPAPPPPPASPDAAAAIICATAPSTRSSIPLVTASCSCCCCCCCLCCSLLPQNMLFMGYSCRGAAAATQPGTEPGLSRPHSPEVPRLPSEPQFKWCGCCWSALRNTSRVVHAHVAKG